MRAGRRGKGGGVACEGSEGERVYWACEILKGSLELAKERSALLIIGQRFEVFRLGAI